MFDWIEFKEIGDELLSTPRESYLRSSIDRYYYAIFCSAREYLITDKNEKEFKSKKDIHKKVCKRMLYSKNNNEIDIGMSLQFLRKMRNHADYDNDKEYYDYFQNNMSKIIEKTENAKESLTYLRRCPNEN